MTGYAGGRNGRARNVRACGAAKPSVGVVAGAAVFSTNINVTNGRKGVKRAAAAMAGCAVVGDSCMRKIGDAR
jgi:hypothetical protein